MAKVTYKDAGVDLEVYDEAMTRLPRLMHRTFSPRVLKLDGGFAGRHRPKSRILRQGPAIEFRRSDKFAPLLRAQGLWF